MLDGVFHDHPAAHAVADNVEALQASRLDQRVQILDHIPQAQRGVDGQRLRVAVTAQVHGDGVIIFGQRQHRLFPEGRRRDVAVDEDHGNAGVLPGGQQVDEQPVGLTNVT